MSKKKKQEQSAKPQGEKKREVKVVYYDDNSTVADMSGTGKKPPRKKSTFKEKWRTYITVVKKMILPMLVTILALTIICVILWAVTGQL